MGYGDTGVGGANLGATGVDGAGSSFLSLAQFRLYHLSTGFTVSKAAACYTIAQDT